MFLLPIIVFFSQILAELEEITQLSPKPPQEQQMNEEDEVWDDDEVIVSNEEEDVDDN
ncbi:MAG: hypothetical protein L0207_05735 [Chlamydiae bacterium]|nr:hypothetical protein [Chlamydiota bacterium]